jgi:hypothetical protein
VRDVSSVKFPTSFSSSDESQHSGRYEKYDAPLGGKKGKADDPFQEEYDEIEAQIDQLMKVSCKTAFRCFVVRHVRGAMLLHTSAGGARDRTGEE